MQKNKNKKSVLAFKPQNETVSAVSAEFSEMCVL